MRQVLTAQLKLHLDVAQFQAVRRTQLAYRDALNAAGRYVFANGKRSNQQALQPACYAQIRTQYGLPAPMACNVPRQGGAPYKILWAKVKASASGRAVGHTKQRYRCLDRPPK
jgi:hypothetical protein